ncbi:MAG: hypothetical protein Q9181_002252 [Wetmoreana brouardii]
MSSSKSPPSTPIRRPLDAPPPPYSESVNTAPSPNPLISRASTLIDSHVLPHLSDSPTTVLVLVPSNVTPLICSSGSLSAKDAASSAFPGEKVVDFNSEENPTVIRLVGAENRLEFWQRAAALRELENQLRGRLSAQGYSLVAYPPKAKSQALNRIAGSKDADWKCVEQEALKDGEARLCVEMSEVCLRIESEMGLYQTRSGKAIVVRVEFGVDEEDD